MSRAVDPFTLANGDLRAEIDPGFGGRVTAFWSETPSGRLDWLVPTPPSRRDPRTSRQSGMFPLVPFSNRIENARFPFEGREWNIEATQAGKPHAIHGHGLRVAWDVEAREPRGATLSMTHDGSDWPCSYGVVQRLELTDTALTARMEVTNLGSGAMPVGLGWHPFLPIRDGVMLRSAFETVWPPIADSIPVGSRALPAELDFSGGRALPKGLDTGFGGWKRKALVSWPSIGVGLRITAGAALDHVILFSPAGRDFFCFEPVSHPINALNSLAPDDANAMAVIAPGETIAAWMTLRPEVAVAGGD